MNNYVVKLNLEVEIQAFDESDAIDYIGDIFNIDDEIKKITINSIREK